MRSIRLIFSPRQRIQVAVGDWDRCGGPGHDRSCHTTIVNDDPEGEALYLQLTSNPAALSAFEQFINDVYLLGIFAGSH